MALTETDKEDIALEPDVLIYAGPYRAQLLENVVISDEEAEVALTDTREEDWSDDLMNREAYKTLSAETPDTFRAGISSVGKSPCLSSDNTGGTASGGGAGGGTGGGAGGGTGGGAGGGTGGGAGGGTGGGAGGGTGGGTGNPPPDVPIPVKAGKVDLGKLKGKVPDGSLPGLLLVIEKWGVDTNVRMAHFLGQCKVESGIKYPAAENMNYRKESQLVSLFGSRGRKAAQFIGDPQKIANIVYGPRTDLGNRGEESGDGWNFRGRGWIQLTGRSNFTAYAKGIKRMDILENAEIVSTQLFADAAGWYVSSRGTMKKADGGFSPENMTAVGKTINSKPVDNEKRQKFTLEFAKILGAI